MSRKFKTPDYEAALNLSVSIREALPAKHLARFVVDIVAQLDLSRIYARYAAVGAPGFAPEILLALLFYGYANGVFSSRKIEKATYANLGFRFVASNYHPDHDTLAHFRKAFLTEIAELFVDILLLAKEAGVLKLGNVSLDGSKIHADASKSHAISYKRLVELETQLKTEVAQLLSAGEQADQGEVILPETLVIEDEVAIRQKRLAKLRDAKKVLEARARERYAAEQSEYQAKLREREEKIQKRGRKLGGFEPKPPVAGPRDNDQYNFTDPESRIMKNSNNDGFDQHYNSQVAVEQRSMLIVATSLSNHPNDKQEALPTLDAISPQVGQPEAAALDNGFYSETNITGMEQRGVEPYVATGREAHYKSVDSLLGALPQAPPETASPKEKMAYKLRTEIGQAIYRLRKCTVEPVIGIIKEILGFRQFSLRGLLAAAGEWVLVCLAFNIKRMHILWIEQGLL